MPSEFGQAQGGGGPAQPAVSRPGGVPPHLVLFRVDAGPEERSLPAIHILLGVTGQLDLPQVLVDVPVVEGREEGSDTRLTLPRSLAGAVSYSRGSGAV